MPPGASAGLFRLSSARSDRTLADSTCLLSLLSARTKTRSAKTATTRPYPALWRAEIRLIESGCRPLRSIQGHFPSAHGRLCGRHNALGATDLGAFDARGPRRAELSILPGLRLGLAASATGASNRPRRLSLCSRPGPCAPDGLGATAPPPRRRTCCIRRARRTGLRPT